MKIRRALISVYDKTGIVDFAKKLANLGFEIISTGGTARKLRDGGISVTDVSEITGFPECFDGRVKTLHPKIHGGILYRSGISEDVATAGHLGINRIDLVVVDLYPFQKTVANPSVAFEDAIEQIDIGGPAMIRAAAKNHRDVIVVCDPADRGWVLSTLQQTGKLGEFERRCLAEKVFATMSDYDGAIDQYLAAQRGNITERLVLTGGRELAYAENKCQNPAFVFSGGSDNPLAMTKFQVVAGNPSFIAIADGSRLVSVLCLMVESFRRTFGKVPFIAIAGKHGNPCGAAVDWNDPAAALRKTLYGNPLAVMGGELIANFPITDWLGQIMHYTNDDQVGRKFWGLDVVLAPDISTNTIELLGKKEKRRLLVNPALADPPFPKEERVFRQLHGGDWLKQRSPSFVFSPKEILSWSNRPLQGDDFSNLIIAQSCCWRATSNTVGLANHLSLISLGCGQQDRIACVRLCLDRGNQAGHNTNGSVFASDAFFPYATSSQCRPEAIAEAINGYYRLKPLLENAQDDQEKLMQLTGLADLISRLDRREGPELLRDAGCIGGVVPADGQKLGEVIEFFGQANMRVAFVASENRGFAQH